MNEATTCYLLAASAGVFYGLSAVLCKRGLESGSGTIRSMIYSNIMMSSFFIPYPIFAKEALLLSELLTGAGLGFIFFLGQFFCFIALRKGDASLITPIMGAKPIFVAIFLILHGLNNHQISSETWGAAGLSALAIGLLCWPTKKASSSLFGLMLALLTAASFGLLDSLVPYFTFKSDPFNVLFFIFGSVGLYSLFLIPWSEGEFRPYRSQADPWMWASALTMGIQAILMSLAIGLYQLPTEANVFYACRGLWAVMLVAWIGTKIGLKEGKSPRSVIIRRAIGSSLLLLGVWLVAS